MKTNYILQIHTGSFLKAHTTFEEVVLKIEPLLKNHQIKAVIFGWHLDLTLNKQMLSFFHGYQVACYFWLPVLSEIDSIKKSKDITNYLGKKANNVQVIEDESFAFFCPTSEQSYNNVCTLYEEQLSMLDFDGVFLDKIRFPSFANGYEEGFGCFCEECEAFFTLQQVDTEYLKQCFTAHDEVLLKGTYDTYGRFVFEDELVNNFYQVRSNMITNLVYRLCDYFHQRNLKVGLDLYAPSLCYLFGQDMYALSLKADFLKPMFYRYTQAPAGMRYEFEAFKQYFKGDSWPFLDDSYASLEKQIKFLQRVECAVYPGIEINAIEGICNVNGSGFNENRSFFEGSFDCLVCCWNCLLMSDEIKQVL